MRVLRFLVLALEPIGRLPVVDEHAVHVLQQLPCCLRVISITIAAVRLLCGGGWRYRGHGHSKVSDRAGLAEQRLQVRRAPRRLQAAATVHGRMMLPQLAAAGRQVGAACDAAAVPLADRQPRHRRATVMRMPHIAEEGYGALPCRDSKDLAMCRCGYVMLVLQVLA